MADRLSQEPFSRLQYWRQLCFSWLVGGLGGSAPFVSFSLGQQAKWYSFPPLEWQMQKGSWKTYDAFSSQGLELAYCYNHPTSLAKESQIAES